MIPDDRRQDILKYLQKKSFARVSELAGIIHVSEPTIRRDLRQLEQEKLIKRSHGGASYISEIAIEWPFDYRKSFNIEQKMYIAGLAVEYIKNNEYIFLDSGSSCYCLSQKMHGFSNLTVLTNSIPSLEILGETEGVDVITVPGRYHHRRHAIFGHAACDFIEKHRAGICFIGGYSLMEGYGLMQISEQDARIKRAYCENADKTVVLFDSTKKDNRGFYKSIPFEKIDAVVSDSPLPESLNRICEEHGIEVVY